MGVPSLPIVSMPYELFGLTDQQIEETADRLIDEIVRVLTTPREQLIEEFRTKNRIEEVEQKLSRPRVLPSQEKVKVRPNALEATAAFYERGWTDGLPVIPPTEELVHEMLAFTDRAPDEVVAKLAPRWGKATPEKIAVNAVMAGCLPEYMPVLIAAVEALGDPAFNLFALQATTNPVAPLAIINGPVRNELKVNYSFGAFGPGWRANATIGRALRLMMVNIGGGMPGTTDKATQGHPAKYTFCVAENEEESPWAPLSVERGLAKGVSAVTVVGVQAEHNFVVWDGAGESILSVAASAMAATGTNNTFHAGTVVLALNPGHAQILAKMGYSKADVQKYLYDNARIPLAKLHAREVPHYQLRRPHYGWDTPDASMPITDRLEDIMVVVVGAVGPHNQFLPTFGDPTIPVTRPIAFRDGAPAASVYDFKGRKR
ncbi:MAG: hypothetical protein HY684_07765 [Chloroflexi bacterium]|nr:hypothetical protein [Chloroflexota bacterium]